MKRRDFLKKTTGLALMASSLHPKDINAGLPEPLQAAEDGMEVVFREP